MLFHKTKKFNVVIFTEGKNGTRRGIYDLIDFADEFNVSKFEAENNCKFRGLKLLDNSKEAYRYCASTEINENPITLKDNTQKFIDELLDFEKKVGAEQIPSLLYAYLKSVLTSLASRGENASGELAIDMFNSESAKEVDYILTVIMVDNKYVYDNYISSESSDLLDFMIDIVDSYKATDSAENSNDLL